MQGEMTIDLAAVITSLVGFVTTIGGFIVVNKKPKDGDDSESKAISLSRVDETDKKVEILITQVDFLFDEISKLRGEKNSLEEQIRDLRAELKTERKDHEETKRLLIETIEKLRMKTERLQILEEIQNKKGAK